MRRRNAGDGKIGCALWLLVAVLVGLIAWKAIPVKINSAQFYDFVEETAKFSGGSSAEALQKQLLARAEELDLPLDEKNLKVSKGKDRIVVEYSYTVPIELPGYTYEWNFSERIERAIFRF